MLVDVDAGERGKILGGVGVKCKQSGTGKNNTGV